MNKSKLGQGHVEMIFSFVLFLGALFLIFMFLNPFAQEKTPSFSIDSIKSILVNNISLNVGELSVILNSSTSDCYDVSSYGSNFVEVPGADPSRTFILYFNLSGTGVQSCAAKTGRNFTLGVYKIENFISYEEAVALAKNYTSNYNSLKAALGINADYLFNFRYLNGTIINGLNVTKNIPYGVDVNSVDIPARVINNSAGISELILNIKAWQS